MLTVNDSRTGNQRENRIAHSNGMPLKDFLTFVPLFATALAIFYDVGYFAGFNLNYFSFFTACLNFRLFRSQRAVSGCLIGPSRYLRKYLN
jgi:hypothetical protein